MKVDIRDFFPSIRFAQVNQLFRSMGFSDEVAHLLASLCTLNGVLPQGASTSPRIADLIFREADEALNAVALKQDFVYSRYADDLAFSGDLKPNLSFYAEIIETVQRWGFSLNHAKTETRGPAERHRVLGFVINEKIHPDRQTRRLLRAKFHRIENPTRPGDQANLVQAQGWASYVNSYDSKLGKRYLTLVNSLIKNVAEQGDQS